LAENAVRCNVESFTAGDGYRWRFRRYLPTGTPVAHVVCVHGIQSHGGWYDYSCGRLAGAGYQTFFLDRRGSGLNEESRGDAPGFRRLLDDLAEFITALREPLPVFLLAISWGGKLGIGLQRRHPGLVEGLALLCPGIYPKVRPSLGQRCAIVAARLVSPRRLFPIPLNDPELFTADPKRQQFIRDDPLGLRQATARLLIESVRLDGYVRLAVRSVRVPVLLLLAGHDRIIDNSRTRRLFDRIPFADKTVLEYPAAHHTLEFEPEPDSFIDDIAGWLRRVAGAGSATPRRP
jgi:alpha-beta hydrolase superfamily lysophospholipase